MKTTFATLAMAVAVAVASSLPLLAAARTPNPQELPMTSSVTIEQVRAVAPALAGYKETRLQRDLWKRPGLSARDRSLITIAALVARGQTAELAEYVGGGLDHGLKPTEISEVLTHLAFYAGWGQAMSAVPVVATVFGQRGVKPETLPELGGARLPIDEKGEALRAERVAADVGKVSPGLVEYTGDVLFKDLWLRPALTPRDRSLVTVTALIANGQVAQIPYHLNRAMDNGLTQGEAGEVLSHLAFYVGWPNVFSAVPVAKSVFEARPVPAAVPR